MIVTIVGAGRLAEGLAVRALAGGHRLRITDSDPGKADALHFPSYGEDSARLLVEQRGVGALGIDTASVDYGPSRDFIVHQIGAARNVANLENLANLDQLPERGAFVIALPMKIAGGSGGPARVVALVQR